MSVHQLYSGREKKRVRTQRGREMILISQGLVQPNCHVWVPEYTRQAPLSTQSSSLRAGWTASLEPRWMLARSACLASTCRCRFNWQQEKKRLRAVHDIPALSPPPPQTLPFWSALTRLWVHLTTHQLRFCFSSQLQLSSSKISLSHTEPSNYSPDETFQLNASLLSRRLPLKRFILSLPHRSSWFSFLSSDCISGLNF